MSINNTLSKSTSWTGHIGEFVAEIISVQNQIKNSYKVKNEQVFLAEPNIRLIRYYNNLGIFNNMIKTGKQTVYNFDHIISFLATRCLLVDDWKLSKISELLTGLNNDEILLLIEESLKGFEKMSNIHSIDKHYELAARSSDVKVQGLSNDTNFINKESEDSDKQSVFNLIKDIKEKSGLVSINGSLSHKPSEENNKFTEYSQKSFKEVLSKSALTARSYSKYPSNIDPSKVKNITEYNLLSSLKLSIDYQAWERTESAVRIRALDELTAIINSLNR